MTGFSIIVPIYNEKENIEKLIKEIFVSLKQYKRFELILVNDSSNDGSLILIKRLKKKYPIFLINHTKNLGQSASIFTGLKKSNYDTIVTIDGDGQNNPNDIPFLLEKYFSNKNLYLVGGIRIKRKDSFIKILSSLIANKIRNFILKDGCADTGCSLKVFDKRVFLLFPYFNGIHRFLPALYKGFGKKTLFVNVDHRPRLYGSSKYGTFKRLIKGISDLIRVANILKKIKRNNA